ncbi:nucleotide sugar dehydrogenase [Clostridium perfringens]|nr:nucleotide sugar dehydrogenase [Clostridium perfringens]MDM0975850.1 nucleotide sugar dehydrogenase [Clostridium perfringens]
MLKKDLKISVVGLGYVGMPLAIAFAKKVQVVGFDINQNKIDNYLNGKDITNEVGDEEIKKTKTKFTSNEKELKKCNFHIVAVPTPINGDKTPDLKPVIEATKIVGRNLSKGSIVVFESTVYPGVTEEICVPILEKESGLKYGEDFKVGYSPERINPGDKIHRLETITKIVSGMDDESLNTIADTYSLVIEAGVYKAQSIKVAEAAKVIENSQRDINIAFVNELSMIFNRMGIDTNAVLKAARTKWNFIDFTPGLVGGHCIGVDPYYLTYRGAQLGYTSQIIAAGRRVNDNMGKYVADEIVKGLIKNNKKVKGAKVGIFGITFKENCPDVRNTKVIDIIDELESFGVECIVTDSVADKYEVFNEYNIELKKFSDLKDLDAIIISVGHDQYKNKSLSEYFELFNEGEKLFVDIKGLFNKKYVEESGIKYWSL